MSEPLGITNATSTPTAGCVVRADADGHISIGWIADNAVTLAKLATQANNTILGNKSGAAAAPSPLSASDVRTLLGLATTDSPVFAGATIGSLAGLIKGTAGALSSATAGTDYIAGGVGTQHYVPYFSATGVLGNSNIYDDGTNVGIGTTNPQNKLSVEGNILITEGNKLGFRYASGDPGPYSYITGGGATTVGFYNIYTALPTAKSFSFNSTPGGTNGETVTILNNGNVGIGTDSPDLSSGTGIHCAGSTFRIATSRTPESASATGNTGEICWDSTYLYVCIATNTWRRIAHATW